MLNFEQLENRDCATVGVIPGWTGSVQIAEDDQVIAVAAGPGGGPRILCTDKNGNELWSQFLGADGSFRGGVKAAIRGDYVYGGAGFGGGPRIDVAEKLTGKIVDSFYIDDPGLRNGADLDGWLKRNPILTTPLLVSSIGGADISYVKGVLARVVPNNVAEKLSQYGIKVFVYPGPAITVLPQFAQFAGVQTKPDGDGDRIYDQVTDAAFGVDAYVTQRSLNIIHELGHAVQYAFVSGTPLEQEWINIWKNSTWNTDYDKLNQTEAFADSFQSWVYGFDRNVNANAFFDKLFS